MQITGLCNAQHTDEDNWASGEERTEPGHPAQTVKHPPATQEAQGRSLGQEDPLEKGMANPLQQSCLENPMDRGAWRATIHGAAESDTTERLTLRLSLSLFGLPTWH